MEQRSIQSIAYFVFIYLFIYLFRLAAISERKVKQDQRRTENTLSINKQSDLEGDYIHAFKDGKRLEAIEVIEKRLSNKSPKLDLVQASRLACLILEV